MCACVLACVWAVISHGQSCREMESMRDVELQSCTDDWWDVGARAEGAFKAP